MRYLLILVSLGLFQCVDLRLFKDKILTDRPVIGVLAQELTPELKALFPQHKSYLLSSYVKFMEQAGAQVVPIMIDRSDDYYENMFSSINGFVLPGGEVNISNSGYQRAAKRIFHFATNRGEYFPIWGTCLGFEQLTLLSDNMRDSLVDCASEDRARPLHFNYQAFSTSHMGQAMPGDVLKILATQASTVNFHSECLTPDNFERFKLGKFWQVLATNRDDNNLGFISLMESIHFPIWGSQFHPEKNAYEWSHRRKNIPHDRASIESVAFFANFFVHECRKNGHHFSDRASEDKHLIYNYNPVFTGTHTIDSQFTQTYIFY